jgi:hypothetical protein
MKGILNIKILGINETGYKAKRGCEHQLRTWLEDLPPLLIPAKRPKSTAYSVREDLQILLHYYQYHGKLKYRTQVADLGITLGRSLNGISKRYADKLAGLTQWDIQVILNHVDQEGP